MKKFFGVLMLAIVMMLTTSSFSPPPDVRVGDNTSCYVMPLYQDVGVMFPTSDVLDGLDVNRIEMKQPMETMVLSSGINMSFVSVIPFRFEISEVNEINLWMIVVNENQSDYQREYRLDIGEIAFSPV